MQTVFYVGKSYPHGAALGQLKKRGYKLGIFHDPRARLANGGLFDYVVPLDFASEEKFLASLKAASGLPKIDGLLCSYENYIVFKAIAAQLLSLPSLSLEAARACTDKYAMRQLFMRHNPGITPMFALVESREQLLAFAASASYPLILKPTSLSKSLLVSKCDNERELLAAYDKTAAEIAGIYERQGITTRAPGIIAEEFITGRMCSVAAFADDSGTAHLCDGIVDLTTAQEAGFDDNFLYARKLAGGHSEALQSKILEVAREGVAALGMQSSPAHIEIIYNGMEAKLVEIGARTGGYRPFLYGHCYEIDMLEQEARIATGATPELNKEREKYAAVYELFPHAKSTFVSLKNANPPESYTYFHQVARPGSEIGPAKDGYKAAAIIGVAEQTASEFAAQCAAIEGITVATK